jgi:hypothetical protein
MPFSPQPVWSFVPTTRSLGRIVGLILAYFVVCKLGLRLATVHPSATAVWPGTGIALAAILLLGYEVWPGIFVGAFAVNLTTAGSIVSSLGIASGNTLEAVIGAYLVVRFANGRNVFNRAEGIFKFFFFACGTGEDRSGVFKGEVNHAAFFITCNVVRRRRCWECTVRCVFRIHSDTANRENTRFLPRFLNGIWLGDRGLHFSRTH